MNEDPSPSTSNTDIDEGIKVLIEMNKNGTYIMKEWQDASSDFNLDGTIVEFIRSKGNDTHR